MNTELWKSGIVLLIYSQEMVFVELENGSTRAGDNQKQGGINTSLFNRKIHREKSAVEMEYGSIRQHLYFWE